jgi:hypothetical protein
MFSIFKRGRNKSFINSEYEIENPGLLNQISIINRKNLAEISDWIPENGFKNSYFNYGVPDSIKDLLNLPIGEVNTYTDLIIYYSRNFEKINYLELGVSVGKNFYQLANYFSNSILTGFDIENINPVLEKKFDYKKKVDWGSKISSIRLEKSTMSEYEFKHNTIRYLAGDIWDESCWQKLKGNKFNVVFSDALHDPKALLWEYQMILKYDLLADYFIMFWDDLNNGLDLSFEDIVAKFQKGKVNVYSAYLIKINGWLGENYPLKHDVGILTNINLK